MGVVRIPELHYIKKAKDYYDMGKGIYNLTDVTTNPNMPIEFKAEYWMLSATKGLLDVESKLLTIICPAAGAIFGLVSDWFMKPILENRQKEIMELYPRNYTALYLRVQGRQCTNRGRVTVPFYVPDYGKNSGTSKKPKIYTTNRIHVDGYVNETDTNYDLTLNGEKAADNVNIPGLTETVITEVNNEYLQPGKNNIIDFDYDTNPGSHSVTTDTWITLVYPLDSEIAYIEEPDTLNEVRVLPDFAVYPENISLPKDLIIGESTKLKFKVYNLGSCAGWYKITVKDGGQTLYATPNNKDECLPMFSSKNYEIDWTPKSDTNQITVVIENTSEGLPELFNMDSNNTASATFYARSRQIPEFGEEIGTGAIYENEPFSVSVSLTKADDITGQEFYLDGTALTEGISVPATGSSRTYRISFRNGLALGGHKLKVKIKYANGTGETSIEKEYGIIAAEKPVTVPEISAYDRTVLYGKDYGFSIGHAGAVTKVETESDGKAIEAKLNYEGTDYKSYKISTELIGAGEHTIVVKAYYTGKNNKTLSVECTKTVTVKSPDDSYFTIKPSADIADPEFTIIDGEGNQKYITYTKLQDGTYQFEKSNGLEAGAEQYTLITKYDDGAVCSRFDKNPVDVNTASNHTIRILNNGKDDGLNITTLSLKKIGETDLKNEITFRGTSAISLTPGVYTLYVAGYIDGLYFTNTFQDIDITSSDQTAELSSIVDSYYLKINGTDKTSAQWILNP